MARTTDTFTISLPPEMMAELESVRKEEHRTRSELIREALRRYFTARKGATRLVQAKVDLGASDPTLDGVEHEASQFKICPQNGEKFRL